MFHRNHCKQNTQVVFSNPKNSAHLIKTALYLGTEDAILRLNRL